MCLACSWIVLEQVSCFALIAFVHVLHRCDLNMCCSFLQFALGNCNIVCVNGVWSGTLRISSAVSIVWSAIVGDTAAFVHGMFVNIKSNRHLRFAASVMFCMSVTSSQVALTANLHVLASMKCRSHRWLWAVRLQGCPA